MAIPAVTTAALLSAPLVVLLFVFGHMVTSAPAELCLESCICYSDMQNQKLMTVNCTSFRPVLTAASSLLSDFSFVDVLNVQNVDDGSSYHIIDGLFGVFSNVKYMNLINASITKIDQNAFKSLKYLEELDLSNNGLYKFRPETFNGTPNLKVLDLSNNPLRLAPTTFLISKSLEVLILSSCNLTSVPAGSFKGLPNLKTLDLYDNQIQSFTLRSFPRNLKHLWLTKNNLTNISTKALSLLNKLTSLDLSENPINCTCSLIGLQDWFSSRGILFENEVICRYPFEYQGESLTHMFENEVCLENRGLTSKKLETSESSCQNEICEEGTIEDRYIYNAVQADQPITESLTLTDLSTVAVDTFFDDPVTTISSKGTETDATSTNHIKTRENILYAYDDSKMNMSKNFVEDVINIHDLELETSEPDSLGNTNNENFDVFQSKSTKIAEVTQSSEMLGDHFGSTDSPVVTEITRVSSITHGIGENLVDGIQPSNPLLDISEITLADEIKTTLLPQSFEITTFKSDLSTFNVPREVVENDGLSLISTTTEAIMSSKTFIDDTFKEMRQEPTITPRQETATTLGEETASTHGQETATTLGEETASTPEQETATTLGEETASTPEQEMATTLGEETASTPKQETATTLGEETASTPGQEMATTLGEETASTPEQETATTLGEETASTPEQETATTLGEETASTPEQEMATTLGEETVSTPGQEMATRLGEETATTPEQEMATTTGQDPPITAGQEPTLTQGQKTATTPGQELTITSGKEPVTIPEQEPVTLPEQEPTTIFSQDKIAVNRGENPSTASSINEDSTIDSIILVPSSSYFTIQPTDISDIPVSTAQIDVVNTPVKEIPESNTVVPTIIKTVTVPLTTISGNIVNDIGISSFSANTTEITISTETYRGLKENKESIGGLTYASSLETTTFIVPSISIGEKSNYVLTSKEEPDEPMPTTEKSIVVGHELNLNPTNKSESIIVLSSTENRKSIMLSTKNGEQRPSESIGSYIVLAGIIIVLLLLILYASTKKTENTSNKKINFQDVENNMTELQDITTLLPSSPAANEKKHNKYPNEESCVTAKLLETEDQPETNGNGYVYPQESKVINKSGAAAHKAEDSDCKSTFPKTNGSSNGAPPLELIKAKVVVMHDSLPRTPIYIQKNVNS